MIAGVEFTNCQIKRVSLRIKGQLVVVLSALCFSPVVVGGSVQPAWSQPRCVDPRGRLIGNEQAIAAKSSYCPGDWISSGSRKLKFLCYWSGRTLSVVGVNWRPQGCRENKADLSPCGPGKRVNCVLRGPGDEPNKPSLVAPYGNTLLSRRPIFSWVNVPAATHYTVQVYSQTGGWVKQDLKQTTLPYPADQPPLTPGKTYRVRVYAYQETHLLDYSTQQLNLLSVPETQELAELVREIKAIGLPQDEEAYLDLNAVYGGRGLLNEAITVLEARTYAGSQSSGVYRALGDRYLQAGRPQQAQQHYQTAMALAEAEPNQPELAKAKEGLQIATALAQPNKK